MNETPAQPSSTNFSQHWMAWLALRHFLPARLLRELISTVIREATGGRLSIEALFEESYSGAKLCDERWVVRPLDLSDEGGKEHDRERDYYVRLARDLVWQNDQGGLAQALGKPSAPGVVGPALVEGIVVFGTLDIINSSLGFLERRFESVNRVLQESFNFLCGTFKLAQSTYESASPDDFWRGIGSQIEPVGMPLRAVMTKHAADWCADADAWDKALAGYDRAGEMLAAWTPEAGWEDVAAAWKTAVVGSRAAALAITRDDPQVAAGVLNDALEGVSLDKEPLRVANLAFDAQVTSSDPRVDGFHVKDRRVSWMRSPLLHDAHDSEQAMRYWLQGEHDDATRRFWGLLRRQIALGAATEAQITKMWYARSLADRLSDDIQKEPWPDGFQMMARLLVESGKTKAVEQIVWSEPLLTAYVKQPCVEMLIAHARAHAGVRIERELVVIELFKTWAAALRAPDDRDIVLLMWRHIADLARGFKAEFDASLDVGRRSLKALQDLAKKRPELRSDVAREVQEAIGARLDAEDDFWDGWGEACKTASAYSDAFDGTAMALVVKAIIDRLARIKPETGLWPVTRPALAFLVSRQVMQYVKGNQDVGAAVLEQILRIDLGDESEHRVVLYHLHDFDAELLADPGIRVKLKDAGVVEHLREQAQQINSSSTTDAIKALLIAPLISGREGVADALGGLAKALDSAKTPRGSMGLPLAYDPLLLLLDFQPAIEAALPEHKDWLAGQLRALLDRIPAVWEAAAEHPVLLAPHGLPQPTKAHPIIVHNWAFASLRFAEALGDTVEIDAALRRASENPELAPHIALGRATRGVARPDQAIDLDQVRNTNPESFYAALGLRLARLRATTDSSAVALGKLLVEKCLEFGPRDIDAAVLMEAARLGLHDHVRASGLPFYRKRVNEDRERRILLRPILDEVFAETPTLLSTDIAARWADGDLLLEVPR